MKNEFVVLHKDLREISRFNFEEGKKEKIEFDQSQHKVFQSFEHRQQLDPGTN